MPFQACVECPSSATANLNTATERHSSRIDPSLPRPLFLESECPRCAELQRKGSNGLDMSVPLTQQRVGRQPARLMEFLLNRSEREEGGPVPCQGVHVLRNHFSRVGCLGRSVAYDGWYYEPQSEG
jgi:hypothetical protein